MQVNGRYRKGENQLRDRFAQRHHGWEGCGQHQAVSPCRKDGPGG